MAREMGDLHQEARIHNGIAEATLHINGVEAAKIRWRQALDLFHELGVPEAQSLEIRLHAFDNAAS